MESTNPSITERDILSITHGDIYIYYSDTRDQPAGREPSQLCRPVSFSIPKITHPLECSSVGIRYKVPLAALISNIMPLPWWKKESIDLTAYEIVLLKLDLESFSMKPTSPVSSEDELKTAELEVRVKYIKQNEDNSYSGYASSINLILSKKITGSDDLRMMWVATAVAFSKLDH